MELMCEDRIFIWVYHFVSEWNNVCTGVTKCSCAHSSAILLFISLVASQLGKFECISSLPLQYIHYPQCRDVREESPIASHALQWRHNERDGVSNHQTHDCLLNCLFRRRSKKTSKLRVSGLCAGNSPMTGEFPTQRASNAVNVSIWWRHHGLSVLSSKNFGIDIWVERRTATHDTHWLLVEKMQNWTPQNIEQEGRNLITNEFHWVTIYRWDNANKTSLSFGEFTGETETVYIAPICKDFPVSYKIHLWHSDGMLKSTILTLKLCVIGVTTWYDRFWLVQERRTFMIWSYAFLALEC